LAGLPTTSTSSVTVDIIVPGNADTESVIAYVLRCGRPRSRSYFAPQRPYELNPIKPAIVKEEEKEEEKANNYFDKNTIAKTILRT
jgi:hypothetical protein